MVSYLKVNLDTNFVFVLLVILLDCWDCSSNFSESFPKEETALFLLLASSTWLATVVGRRDFSLSLRWIWASCLLHYREYRLWNQECSFLNMIGAKTQRQKDFKACRPFQVTWFCRNKLFSAEPSDSRKYVCVRTNADMAKWGTNSWEIETMTSHKAGKFCSL